MEHIFFVLRKYLRIFQLKSSILGLGRTWFSFSFFVLPYQLINQFPFSPNHLWVKKKTKREKDLQDCIAGSLLIKIFDDIFFSHNLSLCSQRACEQEHFLLFSCENPSTETTQYTLRMRAQFFFFFESFNLWRPLLMIALYHQTKTPISFWCRRELNLRSLIQPSEILPVELTGTRAQPMLDHTIYGSCPLCVCF